MARNRLLETMPAPIDNQDAGCPICFGLHIGVKPRGSMAAACVCQDCAATWDHQYSGGEAYRTNIKPCHDEDVTR